MVVSLAIPGVRLVFVAAKDEQFWQSFSDVPDNPCRFATPRSAPDADSGVAAVVAAAGVAAEVALGASGAVYSQTCGLVGVGVAAACVAADAVVAAEGVVDVADDDADDEAAGDDEEQEQEQVVDAADDAVAEQEQAGADTAADDAEEGQEQAGAGIAAADTAYAACWQRLPVREKSSFRSFH